MRDIVAHTWHGVPAVTSLVFAAGLVLACAAAHSSEGVQRPNILIVVADDMGFSDAGCYGGEIATPNIDALAAGGLRFSQFYNTGRCWPTRSCIMTGYYAQQINMDPPRGRLPEWTRTVPHYLKPVGYRCYHAGKWHVMGAPLPVADGGFDHSYHVTDHDRYFSPQKGMEDDGDLAPVAPDSGYYTTTATADRMIGYLKEHAAGYRERPFFAYLAFISPHFPLHAPEQDIARCMGRYDQGWDALRQERWKRLHKMGIVGCALADREPSFAPRYLKPEFLEQLGPGEIPHPVAWSELTDIQKKYQATKMAIHAAMVERMDHEIGRVLGQLREMGAMENTLVLFLSDNGADATILIRGDGHDSAARPGTAASYMCLGPGWASASNSPFRRYKVWTYEAGISTPLIIHWPRGIAARGEMRHDIGHVIDFVPTLLELAEIDPEKEWNGLVPPPLPGRSLVPAFGRSDRIDREYLFFHHEGNRAIRRREWKLVSEREGGGVWELYRMTDDRCEKTNLAAEHPDLVAELSSLWQRCETTFREQAGPPRVKEGAAKVSPRRP